MQIIHSIATIKTAITRGKLIYSSDLHTAPAVTQILTAQPCIAAAVVADGIDDQITTRLEHRGPLQTRAAMMALSPFLPSQT